MAVFDIEQQRMCVRVVFDGVASAGKTTNVQQLAELFATQTTCELFSPAEMDGRTLYFDWLQIAAGMVCGFPLVCQVITVPGQQVLTPRRRHLLSTADVVVHVCDSDEQAVPRALEGLALFDQLEAERGEKVPIVIQANKQDQRGAMTGPALLSAIGRPQVPVVEAIASDGVGVVDTFVTAVRAVVRSITSRVEQGRVHVALMHAETAASVLQKLSAEEVDPEWAIEMLLEEASNAFTFGEPLAPENDADAPTRAGEEEAAAEDEKRPAGRPSMMAGRTPQLPTEDVPTGFIWPAHTGRATLRALVGEPEMHKPVALDAEGSARLVLHDFVLTTGADRRFDHADVARQALVRAARERNQLASLLAPETVLVAQPAGNGVSWLWTILPRLPTVAQLMASNEERELPRQTLLAAFGVALGDALKIEASHGAVLDLSPVSFGVSGGVVRYLGEIAHGPSVERDTPAAIAQSLASLASLCDNVEPAIAALETTINARLTAEDRARLTHKAAWEQPTALPPALRDLPVRLEAAFKRDEKAA